MRVLLFIVAVLLGVAFAQAQQPQPSPLEAALGAKLMTEVNAGLTCAAEAVTLQRSLAAAQARIAELEKKAEPPKDGK